VQRIPLRSVPDRRSHRGIPFPATPSHVPTQGKSDETRYQERTAAAVDSEKPPNSAPQTTATSPPVGRPAGSGRRRPGRRDGAVGEHQAAVVVALGGGRQAAVEFLAEQAGLLARPFGGKQDVGQLGVAQQQAPVVVNEDDAQGGRRIQMRERRGLPCQP
jgi:hypothetical protein